LPRHIVFNTGWLLVDRVLRLALGVAVGIWIARYLGPARFGLLNYAVAFAGAFGALATLGLDAVVVQALVRHPENRDTLLGTAFAMKLASAVLVVTLSVLGAMVVRPGRPGEALLIGIVAGASVFQAADVVDFWFQSHVLAKYTAMARAGAFGVAAIVRLLLVAKEAPLVAFAWAVLLEAALAGALLLLLYFKQEGAHLAWRADGGTARALLRVSWPLALSSVAVWLYMRVDQLMIAWMLDETSVGVYSVAVRLAEVWYFVPSALVSSLFPTLLRMRESDPVLYRARVQALFTSLVLLGYAAAIPISLLARPVVLLLYGEAYAAAWPSLVVLAWAGVFVGLGVAREAWLVAEGLTKFSFATTVCGAVTNILLNAALIPRLGVVGAAIATVVSQAVAVMLATVVYPRTRVIFGMQVRALTLRGMRIS
jgi:PST family polysaccharide transporter